MTAIQRLLLTALAPVALFAQTPAPRLEFEVASVKPSATPEMGKINVGLHIDGAQVNASYFSLKDYIRIAYRVKEFQVIGPDFIGSQRFDISAKLPSGAKSEQVPDMFQTLLTDRFRLTMHHESRDLPVLAIVPGKSGVKLRESAPDGLDAPVDKGAVNVNASATSSGASINLGNGVFYNLDMVNSRVEAKKFPIVRLAEVLARFVDRPVVDMSGITGNYDITLDFPPDDFRAMMIRAAITAGVTLPPEALAMMSNAPDPTGTISNSLQVLGLKLEARKAPYDVLVVDRIEKTPTDN